MIDHPTRRLCDAVAVVPAAIDAGLACQRCAEQAREMRAKGGFSLICWWCTTDFMNAMLDHPLGADMAAAGPTGSAEEMVLLDAWLETGTPNRELDPIADLRAELSAYAVAKTGIS